MILDKEVVIKWNNYTKKWYQDKGYILTKPGDEFVVNVSDLQLKSTVKIQVSCDYCGKQKSVKYSDYNHSTHNGEQKYACADCARIKLDELYGDSRRLEMFNTLSDKIKSFGYTPVSDVNDYKNAKSKIRYICPIHGEKTTTYSGMVLKNCGCQECGYIKTKEKLKLPIDEVKRIVESKNNNILLNKEDYLNASTNNLKVICGCCGEEFTTSLSSILTSNGMCSKCGHEYEGRIQRLSPEEVERRINSINGNVLLNKEEYLNSHFTNLKIRCSCGEPFITSLQNYEHNNVTRCQKCSQRESKGELLVKEILSKYCINFITEYKYDDCKDKRPLPFDFYCVDYDCLIEFDGQQHYYQVYDEESFKRTQYHDQIKTAYCISNNIPLLRIPYFEASMAEEKIIEFLKLK